MGGGRGGGGSEEGEIGVWGHVDDLCPCRRSSERGGEEREEREFEREK